MPKPSHPARSSSDRESLYDQITNQIIAQLEEGRVPWVQPWRSGGAGVDVGMPHNALSGRRYSGINVLLLWQQVMERGYPTQAWLTYRQAQALGGQVRKGERGTGIVFAGRFTPEAEKVRADQGGDDARTIAFLRWYSVFNVSQCDGLPGDLAKPPTPLSEALVDPEVKALIKASQVGFRLGGSEAFYSPASDTIQVPHPDAYYHPIDWHRTALHELGHATGHSSRLNRNLANGFGSRGYAFEELVAEMTAAFTCASLGIEPTVRHADYIGAWLSVLQEDSRAIIRAASQASKAAEWIQALRSGCGHDREEEVTEELEVA